MAEQYAPALELLDRATRLDARGLDYGDDTIYGFPNRSLADVNALRIARLAFLGESEAASQALVGTLRIRRAYADVRGLNSPLDSGASLRLILSFAPPAELGLRALQQEYSKWDVENEIEDRLVDLRAMLIGAVWPGAPGEMPVTPRLRDPQDRGRTPRPVDSVLRPWMTRGVTRLLRQDEEALAAARQPWPAKLDAARDLAGRYPNPPSPSRDGQGLLGFSSFTFLGYLGVNPSASELARLAPAVGAEVARRRVAITALAVERYRRAHSGTVPESLTALVPTYLKSVPTDPFSGHPIRYLQARDTYKVYSVGENRQDENGDWTEIEIDRSHPHFVRRAPRDLGFDIPVR